MIERRGRARLVEEARLGGVLQAVLGQQELQRDGPAQAGVLGGVDHPHAPGAERLEHPEVRDGAPGEAKGIGRGGGGSAEGGFDRREPRIGLGIGGQQVLDGLAQRGIGRAQRRQIDLTDLGTEGSPELALAFVRRVGQQVLIMPLVIAPRTEEVFAHHRRDAAAERREPAQPPGRVQLDQLVEGGLDLLPAARIHGATQRSGSPVSSSASQARAERSSRFAVASETPMAAAVSDSDKPPK